jgi:Tol biopolymer transport system component
MDDPNKLNHVRQRKSRPLRVRWWLGVVLSLAVLLLQGCGEATNVDSGVYVLDTVDSVPRRLNGPAGAPVWAPSGEALAWATEDGLFRQDLTSDEPMLLTDRAGAGRPAWSPDGQTIAFVDRSDESLVAIDGETGEIRFSVPVATEDADHSPLALPVLGGPSWSPDGSRLAFNCWDGNGDEICVVQGDGSGYRQVTHIQSRARPVDDSGGGLLLAVANAGPAAWSPDGTALALAAYPEQRGAASGVFVVDLEAGTARKVSSLLPNSNIMWFSGGKSLLFSASQEGRSDAVRASVAEGGTEKLTAHLPSGAREPVVSPDGTRLAVASGGSIVILGPEMNPQSLTQSGLDHRLPSWSPDGERVAFVAAPDPLASYS